MELYEIIPHIIIILMCVVSGIIARRIRKDKY